MAEAGVKAAAWTDRRDRELFRGLIPALVVLAALTAAPSLYLIVTSLTPLNLAVPDSAWNFGQPFANYTGMFDDPRFTHSVVVQVKLSIASVVLQMLTGLGVALLLHENTKIRLVARSGMLV